MLALSLCSCERDWTWGTVMSFAHGIDGWEVTGKCTRGATSFPLPLGPNGRGLGGGRPSGAVGPFAARRAFNLLIFKINKGLFAWSRFET